MKQIVFYFDPLSPYAYLAFEQLPQALSGLSYSVSYRPVLLGALLQHGGQLGPAEIPGKRAWTYRQVLWLGQQLGVPLRMPARHPFNPLPLLRLAVACGVEGEPNRWVCETLFRHVWLDGEDALDPIRLEALTERLQPQADPSSDAVKTQLRRQTDDAIARGVFGVPTLMVDDRLFWGLDALPMLRSYLEGHPWFAQPDWQAADAVPAGIVRTR